MQHSIFLCFALFSSLLAQGIVQARHIECRVKEAVSHVEELIKKTSCKNQCNKTDGGTANNTYYDQQKNKIICGCLDIPQNTCNLSCFNSGLQKNKHHPHVTKLLSRFSIMITACKDEPCANSCETSTFGNWYSFLEKLRDAFQQIAIYANTKATSISTNVY